MSRNEPAPAVRVADPSEWHAGLSLALAPLAASARGPLIDHVQSSGPHPMSPLDALVVACDGDRLSAACWLQPSAGRVAVCWAPRWHGARPAVADATEREMLAAACRVADNAGLSICQLLSDDEADPALPAAVAAGFRRVARLRYVAARPPKRPPESPPTVSFTPSESLRASAFRALVESTYRDSLDCPALDGLRRVEDTLAGYRAIGRHDPRHWLVARDASTAEPVGVLLLAEHPTSNQLELVYVGVAPEARGRRLGAAMLTHTTRVAHALGVDEIVAAVDEANAPALRMYDRAGYRGWTARAVYVRPRGGWQSVRE